MISGLNQEVDILGKTFHFQTELSDQDGVSIRTEVFVGGKVVATREAQLGEPATTGTEETIRARMKEQHSKTLTTFVARARRYQAREEAALESELATAAVTTPVSPVSTATAPDPDSTITAHHPEPAKPNLTPAPVTDLDPEVATALRIRRCFGEFCERIGSTPTRQDEIPDRIAAAAAALGDLLAVPVFSEIRIDEQVCCHLLKEQIEEWLAQGRDPGRATQIWTDIVTFKAYLAEINQRADLVAYDQRLLIWAINTVQSVGMTAEVHRHLESLVGRGPQLDHLLQHPDQASRGVWVAHLRRLLTQI